METRQQVLSQSGWRPFLFLLYSLLVIVSWYGPPSLLCVVASSVLQRSGGAEENYMKSCQTKDSRTAKDNETGKFSMK